MSNKNIAKILVPVIILVLLSLASFATDFITIQSPSFEDTYISTQNINVLFCSDEFISEPVVKCSNENINFHLELKSFNGCKVAVFNPSSLDCTDLIITAKEGNNYISKELEINKVIDPKKAILRAQNEDGSFGDEIQTAAAIYFLSSYAELYEDEVEDALDWLKANRDNNYKCFPKGACEIYETSQVLYYLQAAGIGDKEKVYYEGKLWLEGKLNYIEDSNWQIGARTTKDLVTCNVIAGDSTFDFEIGDDIGTEEEYLDYSVEYGDTFNVSCDGKAKIYVNDHENRTIYSLNEDIFEDYEIPKGSCFSEDKWGYCNNHLTILGGSINLDESMISATHEYLTDKALTANDYGGEYVISIFPLRDSAIFYREIEQKLSLIKYLVFNQNNDGSYGDGSLQNKLIDTIYITEALMSSGLGFTDDAVRDAKFWISNQMSSEGVNDVIVDSLTRKVFVNDYIPYLDYDVKIIDLTHEDNMIIDFANPTIFNITNIRVDLDDDVIKILSYEISNATINTLKSSSFNITRNKVNSGLYEGYMNIYGTVNGKEYLIAKIPVTSDINPSIELTPKDSITVVGSMGKLPIKVNKINSDFDCTLSFDSAAYADADFLVALNHTNVDAYFDIIVPKRELQDHNYLISCKSGSTIINDEGTVLISRYPSDIYSFVYDSVQIKNRNRRYFIPVKNNLFEEIEIDVKFKIDSGLLKLESSKLIIPSNGTENIYFSTMIGKEESFTFDEVLVLESFGITKEAKIIVNVQYVPFWERIWVKIAKWSFILIIVLGISYALYYYSLDIFKASKSAEEKTQSRLKNVWQKLKKILPEPIRKMLHIKEETEMIGTVEVQDDVVDYGGIDDIVKIMISMNKEESVIRKRLRKEGLSEEEISGAIAQVNKQISEENELEKEKSVVDVIKKMEDESDLVKDNLKSAGFSDKDITQAFDEIEHELADKQKALEEHLKKFNPDDEDDDEEISLLDTTKED